MAVTDEEGLNILVHLRKLPQGKEVEDGSSDDHVLLKEREKM
jgi:hypothetical protein